MKNNQKGFTVVEGILILVIVTLISGIGWYVWNNKNSNNNLSNPSPTGTTTSVDDKEQAKQAMQQSIDETKDWKSISTKDGAITIKFPPTLYAQICANLDKSEFIGVSAYSDKGACGNYEMPGYMTFRTRELSSNDATFCSDQGATGGSAKDQIKVTSTLTKINNRSVCQIEGSRQVPKEELIDYQYRDYSKTLTYEYRENNTIYTAHYTQFDSYPDSQDTFNTIYQKTLQFK